MTMLGRLFVLPVLLGVLAAAPGLAQVPEVPPFDRDAAPGAPPPVPGVEGSTETPDQEGEVLGRGPIHEAFAQPSQTTPRPGPVVPRQPPAAIREMPPEEKPEGDDVVWIPGYWAWDEDRNDFLWVSGFWRVPPAGRRWVPGYWTEAEGGWRWVSGLWADAAQPEVPYVPEPPATLERGPSVPPVDDSYSWVPGLWMYRDDSWLWRPGYWCAPRPGFVYSPPSYAWTPGGYAFVSGYWDRCLENRGLLFAPVAFSAGVYSRPGFCFTPRYTVGFGSSLLASLWVRPGWNSYAFGDFYGAGYAARGYQPWYAWGARHRDPLFGYYRNLHGRTNPGWTRNLAAIHAGRARGTLPVPPRTLAAGRRGPGGAPALVQSLTSYRSAARPLTRVTALERAQRERAANALQRASVERARVELRSTPRVARPGSAPVIRTRPNVAAARPGTTLPTPQLRQTPPRPATRSLPPPLASQPRPPQQTTPRTLPAPRPAPRPGTAPAIRTPRYTMPQIQTPRTTTPRPAPAPGPRYTAPQMPRPTPRPQAVPRFNPSPAPRFVPRSAPSPAPRFTPRAAPSGAPRFSGRPPVNRGGARRR